MNEERIVKLEVTQKHHESEIKELKESNKTLTLTALNTLRKQLETKYMTLDKVNKIVGDLLHTLPPPLNLTSNKALSEV